MKTLINLIGVLAWSCFIAIIFFLAGMVYQERNPNITVQDMAPTFTQQVKNVQREAGCILIDAKIGLESITKINAKVEEEYCQQANDWSVANMPKEQSDE